MSSDGFEIENSAGAIDADGGLRDLIEDLDAVVWQADPETLDFSFVSRRGVELFGYPREKWYEPGFWATQLIHPEDRERAVAECRLAIVEGRDHQIEYRVLAADGRVSWMRDRVRIATGSDGAPEALRGVMIDITAEKAAEDRFKLLADHIPQVFWIATPEGRPEYASPAMARTWGRSIESFEDWVAAIHPEDRERVSARYRWREGTDELEYRILWPDGSERWVLDRAYPIRDADGTIRRVVGTTEDITDWKLAQERIELAEAHYRRLVNTAPYGVFVVDVDGSLLELNPAAEEIVGAASGELLGALFTDLIPPEGLEEATGAFQALVTGESDRIELEMPVRHSSGAVRFVRYAAAPIVVAGVVTGVHGIARDITHERARDSQRLLLEAALDNLPDAVSITRGHRFLYVNPSHAALLGYDASDPPGTIDELLPDDEARRQLEEIDQALRSERRWSGRMRRSRPDGSIVLLSTTVFAVSDAGEESALAVMRDATEEISREQHLRRVERLASLGTLIGGVAHELNNPLTAVVGFAHLMLLDEHSDENHEMLETVAREAERAARIVSDLRLVARNTQQEEKGEREIVDVNEIVREVLEQRHYSIETRHIHVTQRLARKLPPVWADRAQLVQVVSNIVVNAEQALSRVPERPRQLLVSTRPSALGIALHVADNGSGIRREYLDRIFDPFFTTKSPGEGTGLGLSLAHSIVSEHGGSLRVESEPDGGAEFVIDLPALDPAVLAPEASASGDSSSVSSLRVLVVDEEAPIRELLARALRKRGHVVTEAGEGAVALTEIEDPDADFDVIVSDLRMPGFGGEQLLERLRDVHPALARRVVFMTGDPTAVGAGPIASLDIPIVMKPFKPDEISLLIEQRMTAGE